MMSVVTNHHPRPVLDASELTAKEREAHDYLDWDALKRGEDTASFVRYKGVTYYLSDFSADYGITKGAGLPHSLSGWDGYFAVSFRCAIVVRYVDDDYVVMGAVFT